MKQKKKLRDIFKKYKAFQDYYVDEIGHAIPKSAVHFKHVAPKKPLDNKLDVKEEVSPEHPHIRDWFSKSDNDHIHKLENYDFDTHVDRVSQHLIKNQKPMSESDSKHVNDYTYDSYSLNKNLIDNHLNSKEIDSEHHDKIKSLDSVSNNKLNHKLNLYSGVKFHPGELAKASKDSTIHLPAYTSMTHDKRVASRFSRGLSKDRHIIHLHLNPGDKVGHISHVSQWQSEHESILPRNSQLKINPVPDIYTDDQTNKTHIWHATISHQD